MYLKNGFPCLPDSLFDTGDDSTLDIVAWSKPARENAKHLSPAPARPRRKRRSQLRALGTGLFVFALLLAFASAGFYAGVTWAHADRDGRDADAIDVQLARSGGIP